MKLVLCALLAACSSPAPTPTPAPAPAPTPAPAAPAAPGIGEKCGEGDQCAMPATCVAYYGIAGAKGPQFKTCEIKCSPASKCPEGKACATIADGPGSVCR